MKTWEQATLLGSAADTVKVSAYAVTRYIELAARGADILHKEFDNLELMQQCRLTQSKAELTELLALAQARANS